MVSVDRNQNKFAIQDAAYSFPYHYLVQLNNETPRIYRMLDWGMEYLTYLTVVRELLYRFGVGKRILDVGCGDGFLLNSLDVQSFSKLAGIDLSERAIRLALALGKGPDFKAMDVDQINEKYDVITLVEVLEHIPDGQEQHFLSSISGKIVANGRLIVSVPSTVRPVVPKHFRHYDMNILKKRLGDAGLTVEEIWPVYARSILLERSIWLLRNSFWVIRLSLLWKILWKWHRHHTFMASEKNGCHYIVVCKTGRPSDTSTL
jgi:SAM-dependent methyltransferase